MIDFKIKTVKRCGCNKSKVLSSLSKRKRLEDSTSSKSKRFSGKIRILLLYRTIL